MSIVLKNSFCKFIPLKIYGKLLLTLFSVLFTTVLFSQIETHIRKKLEIKDGIAPKSIVSNGKGVFAAQNMMYRHSITLYNSAGERLAKIKDEVNLKDFGLLGYSNSIQKGAPVEGVFTKDGRYLWVSNYNMTGPDFTNPGCDNCIGTNYDPSFLYKINTETFAIENVVKVGSVPKFLAISADEKTLIVSNWVSSTISIIDLKTEVEIKQITVGSHPRGIAITADNKMAFITIMGSTKIAVVNLENYEINYLNNLGRSPRSILLADNDSTLYISFNSSSEVLKLNRFTHEKTYCKTLAGPRSMTLSPSEKSLYIVNYFDNVFTKINTDSMKIEAEIETSSKPIGICGNWKNAEIWVACYSGKIEIFKDFNLEKEITPSLFSAIKFPNFSFNYTPNTKTFINDSIILDTATPTLQHQPKVETLVYTPKSQAVSNIVLPSPKLKKSINYLTKNDSICSFHIIVGAFSIKENAENRKNDLLALGLPAQIINGAKLTYVSAQCFSSKKLANLGKNDVATKIIDCGTPWILEWK